MSAQDYQKAIKMCKYSISALQYEDSSTAIENLTKALKLLTTGHEWCTSQCLQACVLYVFHHATLKQFSCETGYHSNQYVKEIPWFVIDLYLMVTFTQRLNCSHCILYCVIVHCKQSKSKCLFFEDFQVWNG